LTEVTKNRVCRLVWDYPVKGISSYGLQPLFVNLSEEQVRQGHEVHVIALGDPKEPREEISNGVNVHRVPKPFNVTAMRRLWNVVGVERDWVVHTHATCGVFLAPLKPLRTFPLVCHAHVGSELSWSRRRSEEVARARHGFLRHAYFRVREKAYWSSADAVLSVSDDLKSEITRSYGLNPSKVRVVYNGVDAKLFSPIPDAQIPEMPQLNGKKVVLYVGHFGTRKGVAHLVKAMVRVRKEVPEAVLVCVGGAPAWLGEGDFWGSLERLIATNGLEGSVFLLDKVPNKSLPAFYSACSVFALPSYHEAFAKVVIEAMACAKPVVVTKEGIPNDVVQNGGSPAGLLVDFGKEEQLADALVAILQDEGKAREMGNNGRRRVLADFTWERVVQRIDSVYQEVAAR
jgi:1,4-alpha-glucan branching enzyme